MSRFRIQSKTLITGIVRQLILPAFLLSVFSFYSPALFAREPAALSEQPLFYTLKYAGNNLWNPGLEAGAELLLYAFPGHSGKGGGLSRQLFFASGIGLYVDPGSHAALYTRYGASYRRTGPRGWSHSLEVLPAGVYRSFLAETWLVEEGASPKKIMLPGRTYYAPGIGYHVGRDSRGTPSRSWFAGCSMTVLVPYNTYVMPVLTIDLGWRFSGRKEGK